ncbi:hypothetical protein G3480_18400 [Thiorhodococcus mannitoliphagus]|uniref:Uncharacterized protein n=1 Tax=Thiorhodococcus mannitoliphagus TaxID=329406 RepID=A0A6P1E189_9GAMM|nr:hypothetical protein [Thiorhodococcus mannitoliphagus]NEX22252.1 hypothetical protein [Thiorhodococcus mannitoliphagus]
MLSRRISDERALFLCGEMELPRDRPGKIRQNFDARAAKVAGLLAPDMAEAQAIAASNHPDCSTEPTRDSAGYRINHFDWAYLLAPDGEISDIDNDVDLNVSRMLDDLKTLHSDDHGH